MKTIAYFKYLTLFLACSALFSCGDSSQFNTTEGNSRQISDYRGKWLVVNFWAEWCAPCREEIPQLNLLAATGQPNATSSQVAEIAVLGVSYDRLPNDKIRQIASDWGIDYPLVMAEPMPLLPFALPKKLPTTYLIGPEGKVVWIHEGKLEASLMMKKIAELSAKS